MVISFCHWFVWSDAKFALKNSTNFFNFLSVGSTYTHTHIYIGTQLVGEQRNQQRGGGGTFALDEFGSV